MHHRLISAILAVILLAILPNPAQADVGTEPPPDAIIGDGGKPVTDDEYPSTTPEIRAWRGGDEGFRVQPPASLTLPIRHQTQIERNYCGPAVMSMALSYYGIKIDQHTLAKHPALQIYKRPSMGTGLEVMQRILNEKVRHLKMGWERQNLPVKPTTAHVNDFSSRVLRSIADPAGKGRVYSVPINVYYPKKAGRPKGYLPNRVIAHHILGIGYTEYGNQVKVHDPVGGRWDGAAKTRTEGAATLVREAATRGYLF